MRDEPWVDVPPIVMLPAPVIVCEPPPSDWIHAVLPLPPPTTVMLPPPLTLIVCGATVLFRMMALVPAPVARTSTASPDPLVPVVVMVWLPGNGARKADPLPSASSSTNLAFTVCAPLDPTDT